MIRPRGYLICCSLSRRASLSHKHQNPSQIHELVHAFPGVRDDPSPEVGPPANYGIVPIEWDLPTDPATPDGATIQLNGTIQEVVARMKKDYPAWNKLSREHIHSAPPSDTWALDIGDKKYEDDKLVCEDKWANMCSRAVILDGVYHLMNRTGQAKPKNGPGPGNCGRVSCSQNDAIYWCNDNKEEKELDSWDAIAVGAYKIWNDCQFSFRDLCGGQMYYKDNWSVVVKRDNC